MKGLKTFILLAALILPILVFLFLKFFGKNEFKVDPLYQTEASIPDLADCSLKPVAPYAIPDTVYASLQRSGRVHSPPLLAVAFLENPLSTRDTCSQQIERITEKYSADSLSFAYVFRSQDERRYSRLLRCTFFSQDPEGIVLLDPQRRIRGFYDCSDVEDMDRMMAEITIILKKY